MPGDDEELRLNTLHRFAKHSPKLTLEEHSHCEVPAGCGGVVMRWVDPADGVGAMVQCLATSKAQVWIDGARLDSTSVRFQPGRHVVGIELAADPKGLDHGLIVMVTSDGPAVDARREVFTASTPGPGWELSGSPPPPDWCSPQPQQVAGFEPIRKLADTSLFEKPLHWRKQRLEREGARALRLPPGQCWVRHGFEVKR